MQIVYCNSLPLYFMVWWIQLITTKSTRLDMDMILPWKLHTWNTYWILVPSYAFRSTIIACLPPLIRIFDFVNVRLTMLIYCLSLSFLHFICLSSCLKKTIDYPIEMIMLPKGFNFKRRLTLSLWLRPIYHKRTGGCVRWVCRFKRIYRDWKCKCVVDSCMLVCRGWSASS